jgi:hypothetical protein
MKNTKHRIGKGCTIGLAEFCDRNGIPLVTIVNAINRGTFTEKEGLVIGPSLLKVHTCAFEARFRRPEAA